MGNGQPVFSLQMKYSVPIYVYGSKHALHKEKQGWFLNYRHLRSKTMTYLEPHKGMSVNCIVKQMS